RPDEPRSGSIPGEHPPGPVGAVGRRGEPDDQQPRPRIAEPRDRLPPVRPSGKLALPPRGDARTVAAEPGAGGARDDLARQGPQQPAPRLLPDLSAGRSVSEGFAPPHRPVKWAGRFSRKARIPSRLSSVPNSWWKHPRSNSSPPST